MKRNRKPFTDQIKQWVIESGAQNVKYIRAVRPALATGLVAAVYAQVATDFQVLPPLTVFSPAPRLLAGVWSVVRETLLVGPVPRIPKEVVATAVSMSNTCAYCVDAHSLMLRGGLQHDTAIALVTAQPENINDPLLRSLANWAWRTRSPLDQDEVTQPFTVESAAQIIGTAVAFHFINRVVDVFLDRSALSLPRPLYWARGLMGKFAEHAFARRLVNMSPIPGRSLELVPYVSPSSSFPWAQSNPFVAAAFARLEAIVEELGDRVVPADVRQLVSECIDHWDGEHMGMNRSWVERELRSLEEGSKAVGRLALLTALSSYQVDANIVEGSRARLYDDDESLLGTVAWSAFAAARRVGSWLEAPDPFNPRTGELIIPPDTVSASANFAADDVGSAYLPAADTRSRAHPMSMRGD
jgi:AhpD family alkylhydroperoxidase